MKFCVIGNSHVGALKTAWDSMAEERSSTSITFFVARSRRLKDLAVRDGVLTPTTDVLKKSLEFTSGGLSQIDPNDYDAVIVYGVFAKGLFLNPDKHYSSAVLDQVANDHVTGTLSFELIRSLRSITDRRIFVGHDPLRAFRGRDPRSTVPASYHCGLELMNERVYSPINSELLAQPEDTIVNGRYTDPRFSQGSMRLAVGDERDGEHHAENDFRHMNDAFGARWLTAFFRQKHRA